MRLLKQTTLLLAGLSVVACSNDDVLEQSPVVVGKNASLTLKVYNPGMGTKAVGDPTTADTKKITVSNLTVKFLPGGTYAKIESLNIEGQTGTEVKLYGVPEGTTGIEIVGNNVQTSNENAFKSTSKAETEKESPVSGATVYGIDTKLEAAGTIVGDGQNNSESGMTYSNYKADVTVSPVTARIELSGLKFAPNESSNFTKLQLLGVFMNGYYADGTFASGNVTAANVKNYANNPSNPSGVQDYVTAIKNAVDLWDGFDSSDVVFYDASKGSDDEKTPTFPSGKQAYGYNFFVKALGDSESETTDPSDEGASLPRFTVALAPTYVDSPTVSKATVLYGVITKYTIDGSTELKRFKPGKIYQITELTLPEDALTPDPSGDNKVSITATVKVVDWELQSTDGTWAGQ